MFYGGVRIFASSNSSFLRVLPATWKVHSILKMIGSKKSAFSSILLIIFRTEIFAYLPSSFFRGCTTVNLYSLKFWRLCITRYTVICKTPTFTRCTSCWLSDTSNAALPYLLHNNVGSKWSSVWHQMTHWTAGFHRILFFCHVQSMRLLGRIACGNSSELVLQISFLRSQHYSTYCSQITLLTDTPKTWKEVGGVIWSDLHKCVVSCDHETVLVFRNILTLWNKLRLL